MNKIIKTQRKLVLALLNKIKFSIRNLPDSKCGWKFRFKPGYYVRLRRLYVFSFCFHFNHLVLGSVELYIEQDNS